MNRRFLCHAWIVLTTACWGDAGLGQSYRIVSSPEGPRYLDEVQLTIVDERGRPAARSAAYLRRAQFEPLGILDELEPGRYRAVGAGTTQVTVRSGAVELTHLVEVACPVVDDTAGVLEHAGEIRSDEHWQADAGRHRVLGEVRIGGDATVVVGACATVELGTDASIIVGGGEHGRLVVRGTREHPVRFTGVPDDGGLPQVWNGIRLFLPDAAGSVLRWMQITDARGVVGLAEPRRAVVDLVGDRATIMDSEPVVLSGVRIDGGDELGFRLRGLSVATCVGWNNNAVHACGGFPVSVDAMSMAATPRGDFAGNGVDRIEVTGGWTGPNYQVWRNPGVPYRVTNSMIIGQEPGDPTPAPANDQRLGGLYVLIEAGVTLRFARETGLFVGSDLASASADLPRVRLIAHGTLTAPVRFTSDADPPSAGDWIGIVMLPNTKIDIGMGQDPTIRNDSRYAMSSLIGTIIEYAGGPSGLFDAEGNERRAGLLLNGYTAAGPSTWLWLLEASTIRHTRGHAISAPFAPLELSALLNAGSADRFIPSCLCGNELGPLSPPSPASAPTACPCPGVRYWAY